MWTRANQQLLLVRANIWKGLSYSQMTSHLSFFHFAERKVLVVMTRPWEDNGVTKHQPLERDKDYEGNPYLN